MKNLYKFLKYKRKCDKIATMTSWFLWNNYGKKSYRKSHWVVFCTHLNTGHHAYRCMYEHMETTSTNSKNSHKTIKSSTDCERRLTSLRNSVWNNIWLPILSTGYAWNYSLEESRTNGKSMIMFCFLIYRISLISRRKVYRINRWIRLITEQVS